MPFEFDCRAGVYGAHTEHSKKIYFRLQKQFFLYIFDGIDSGERCGNAITGVG
jgi:hypothetical protein